MTQEELKAWDYHVAHAPLMPMGELDFMPVGPSPRTSAEERAYREAEWRARYADALIALRRERHVGAR